jgi:hypothetical protein
MMMTRSLMTVALFALVLAGCDAEVTGAAAGTSRMDVGMRGDDPSSAPSATRSTTTRYDLSGGGSGSVEVEARVWVETKAGEWVEVTDGAESGSVDASGSGGVELLASSEVSATSYQRVRVEFDRVRASLIGGISLGGDLLNGTLTVDTGSDGKIVVERDISVDARAGGTSHLVLNLNAGEWMGKADTETRAVAEAEFRSAVAIMTE